MSGLVRQYEQLPVAARIIGALSVVGTSGYFAWENFVVPKAVLVEERRQEQEKLENELKIINKDFINPATLEEELASANREFKKLVELLPQDPSVDRVLNDFASLSRLTGTEIREFKPGKELNAASTITQIGQSNPQTAPIQSAGGTGSPTQDGAVFSMDDTNAVGLTMKMYGTFPAIVSFLDMAMALPRVVRIQDFEILNTDKELKLTQKPKLTFNGLFHAYFQKPNATAETATSMASNSGSAGTAAGKSSPKLRKPAIDLNNIIDKSFSSKPLSGEN